MNTLSSSALIKFGWIKFRVRCWFACFSAVTCWFVMYMLFFLVKSRIRKCVWVRESRIEFELCLIELTRIQSRPYWGWLRGYMTITTTTPFWIDQFGISSTSAQMISITTAPLNEAICSMRISILMIKNRLNTKKNNQIIMTIDDGHKCTPDSFIRRQIVTLQILARINWNLHFVNNIRGVRTGAWNEFCLRDGFCFSYFLFVSSFI